MKISKRQHYSENGFPNGWHIIVTVGKHTRSSWWSAPPKDIIVSNCYLRDRGYFFMTTEKRRKEFVRLWAELWKEPEHMKPLKVWECEYCKQLFKTPDRHKCKYGPKSKNCYSCEHCIDFYGEKEYYDDFMGREQTENITHVQCDKGHDVEAKEIGNGTPAKCGDYSYCGCKWYENSHEQKRIDNMLKGDDGDPF